jgi:integrase
VAGQAILQSSRAALGIGADPGNRQRKRKKGRPPEVGGAAPKEIPVSVYRDGRYFHYDFWLDGRRHRGSTRQATKEKALAEERRLRQRLSTSYEQTLEEEARVRQRRTVTDAANEYFEEYKIKHRGVTFAEYALGHIKRLLGERLLGEVTKEVMKRYQTDRLKEGAGPKSVNDEVQFLLRLLGEQGDTIRGQLRREKALQLKLPPSPGRAYGADEKTRMLEAARGMKRSPQVYPALVLTLNTGLRDKELRQLRWRQIDLMVQKTLMVGDSKSEASTGRIVPLNGPLLLAIEAHAAWYARRFGECRPDWFVFAFGKPQPTDPTRPVTSFKTAWTAIREKAQVKGRWHDHRHTLVTELAESGAGDEVIMAIAGHVSRAMLKRYSHIRLEAKRRALEEIARRQHASEEKQRQTPPEPGLVPGKVPGILTKETKLPS